MILHFPKSKSKVWGWAKTYATIYSHGGQIEAGNYAAKDIPEQFHTQIDPLVQEEYDLLIKGKK